MFSRSTVGFASVHLKLRLFPTHVMKYKYRLVSIEFCELSVITYSSGYGTRSVLLAKSITCTSQIPQEKESGSVLGTWNLS